MNVPISSSNRLLSLDVFRGITVAGMIVVNNPGDWGHIYAPLKHADWNGCTFADLIFPFFLFIVGVSISSSFAQKKSDQQNASQLLWIAAKRSIILFGLGLFLAAFPLMLTDPILAIKEIRIPGILQRIAVVFFVSVVIYVKTKPTSHFKIMIGLLVVYWFLLKGVPVPGVGFANLEKQTNLVAWFDRIIFGEAHLWKLTTTWDPEGFLSTIPAIATCLLVCS